MMFPKLLFAVFCGVYIYPAASVLQAASSTLPRACEGDIKQQMAARGLAFVVAVIN